MNRIFIILVCVCFLSFRAETVFSPQIKKEVISTLHAQVIRQADSALLLEPVTVTASRASRSAGGIHDFYSEGDYWWPDPAHVDSPYVQRDGLTNPDNFVAHREAMIRFSRVIGSLASAYTITKDEKYARQIIRHCNAWFTDTATRMNPSLLFAQAIKGRATGRGIGIIDTIQLMEVVKGLMAIQFSKAMDKTSWSFFQQWFSAYIQWLETHPYGKAELEAKNNHGTCWVMQVAVFAQFTNNKRVLDFCKDRFKSKLLPEQMAADGSFPLELRRTKPYGYSIFNLDAMTTICQVLSTPKDDLWSFTLPDGRNMKKGIDFLYPFIKDKSKWTFQQDVMYWNNWPVAQPFLVFGTARFNNKQWLQTWKALDHSPEEAEVIRNLPVRNPLIWL
ncbi:alginate lyase family protein [Terrimonas sp. NA20]|uniref:Alginate lyase family protein n=1 Tax=Terrimonas ginsenosidimutans TaxID=2908004 RepID=A0ABS9KNW6_9BACT|nr:alginate lyase family protein [Terrimonas ginsenosidimutans]MCG2614017.1 alginate lyase family protein [Terrimonas ginsenosidimutans]